MRRILLPLAALLLGAAALVWWLDPSGWRAGAAHDGAFSGYVEADYVFVTSALGGTLTELSVARGDRVAAGAPLFRLDNLAERAAREEANARLAQTEAQYGDLLTGRRPEEIAAIEAQRAQMQAALQQSEAEFRRQSALRSSSAFSAKQLDDARGQRDRDRARLEEMEAQLRVAKLAAREDQIRAAEATIAAARAALAQADWRLAQKQGAAPADGSITDTLFRPGEMVAAGQPIVQLLPPGNIKIRFFVPETAVAKLAVGDRLRVTCDGCAAPVEATVRFVSPQAEFTPPVIYSREQRTRLVFMVEARPLAPTELLRVGQPVDVLPLNGAAGAR